ncbi:hypothetical protein RQP46_002899 [Phenoliferia psychrophenolica]
MYLVSPAIVWALGASLLTLALQRLSQIGKREAGLPPGPPTTPVLGNILQVPMVHVHEGFQALSRVWGPMFSLKIFNSTIIVLNDAKTVHEVMDKEILRFSVSLALIIGYGKRAATLRGVDAAGFSAKEALRLAHESTSFLNPGGAPPVDLFPILKLVPEAFAPWKVRALKARKDMQTFYHDVLFDELKRKRAMGKSPGCWMDTLIDQNGKSGPELSEETLSWQGGALLEGGGDTTSAALLLFILAAVLHPDKVAKVQAEIDAVVPSDRSPTLDDDLPYLQVYNGYIIPGQSMILYNLWSIMHDPDCFDQPDEFIPERFLENKFGLKKGASEDGWRSTMPFGVGRRICVGLVVAEQSRKAVAAKVLCIYTFVVTADGDAFEDGLLLAKPFKCSITPRNDTVKRIIEGDYEDARPLLESLEFCVPA